MLSWLPLLLVTALVLLLLRTFVLSWLPLYFLRQLAVVAAGLFLIRWGGAWMFLPGACVMVAGLVMVKLQERGGWR